MQSVPCGACQDTGECWPIRHLKAREMIVDVDYPTRGTYQDGRLPDQIVGFTRRGQPSALLGEHTDVLLEALCGVEPR